jgi:hypothetical protein
MFHYMYTSHRPDLGSLYELLQSMHEKYICACMYTDTFKAIACVLSCNADLRNVNFQQCRLDNDNVDFICPLLTAPCSD